MGGIDMSFLRVCSSWQPSAPATARAGLAVAAGTETVTV